MNNIDSKRERTVEHRGSTPCSVEHILVQWHLSISSRVPEMEVVQETKSGFELANNSEYLLIQFSSVTQSCLNHNPIDCSTPGFPVHHQRSELAQTHACRVGNVIQSSHPLSTPFPPAFNLSQHQGLFQ